MTTKQQEIDFKILQINLQSACYNHLMNINKEIREKRNIVNKEQLFKLKNKRKQSDQLLSEIKKIKVLDYFNLNQCEMRYKQF